MKTYEYLSTFFFCHLNKGGWSYNDETLELNELGKVGWQVVYMCPKQKDFVVMRVAGHCTEWDPREDDSRKPAYPEPTEPDEQAT